MKLKNPAKKISELLYWSPRILGIIFIIFLLMFSLDVFGEGLNTWQTIIGLFVHNIPALILLITLIVSWKYEIVGGVVFIFAGLFYVLMLAINPNFKWFMISWITVIGFPAFLIGILFTINWIKKLK